MRRSNREVTGQEALARILDECDICRLALCDNGQPYVVPLNFGYRWDGLELEVYFHCARAGRKLDIIARNNKVCLEFDRSLGLNAGEKACQWSMNFESVIAEGEVAPVEDPAEREAALNRIMRHYSGRGDWHFEPEALAKTHVLKVTVREITGKRLCK